MTSVKVTWEGTVLIIRSNRLPQVDWYASALCANLKHRLVCARSRKDGSYLDIVLFPSLVKIRKSEFVVSFAPNARGLFGVPDINSVALQAMSHKAVLTPPTYTLFSKAPGVESKLCRPVRLSSGLTGGGTISVLICQR